MKYKNIKKLGDFFKNSADDIDEESLKYISELTKLIPYVGSFIDSQTFQRIKDKRLSNRLDQIEKISRNALTVNDGLSLLKIVEENRLILYSFISNYRDIIFEKHPELIDKLNSFLTIPESKKSLFEPNNNFQFIVISGASATGKDVQLEKLINVNFPNSIRVDILRKFTSRKKRLLDSEYYRFKTEKGFQKFLDQDKIIFPYSKRENRYGFDKLQLAKDATTDTLLLTVFTEFSILKQAKQFLIEQGVNAKFILFEAPYQELEERTWHRNLSKEDVRQRLRSIKYDINFIKENDELINEIYDYRIYTGDRISKNDIHLKLIEIITKEIKAPNHVYKR